MSVDRKRNRSKVGDAFTFGRLGSVSVFMSRLLVSMYICALCSLLLEATSSVLLTAKSKYRYSNSGALRLTVPQASASPMPSADSSSTGHTYYGTVNCMIGIHDDITWCNNTYHQALKNIIVRGYRKESNRYKRQFCCGFWSRERCVTDAVRRKCDKDTFERIIKDQSPYVNELVDTRQSSGISCLGFEQNSSICSAAAVAWPNSWLSSSSSPLLALSALIYYWLTLTYFL